MVNPITLIGSFFKWLGWRQSRETGLKSAQLSLAEEQHRAEVFALEQRLQITESNRDGLKSQLNLVEKERDAAIRALKTEKDERENLHNQLESIRQQASKDRIDRKAEDMLFEIAKRKEGYALDSLFFIFFGKATPQGEHFFAQLVRGNCVEKIGVNAKGADLWGATEKGKQLAFSRHH